MAVKGRADLLVSHHPLIWDAIKRIRTDDPAHAPLITLAKAGVSAFAAHTNLDISEGGVNDILADALGLKDTRPLFPVKHAPLLKLVTFVPESHVAAVRDAVSSAGAGEIGDYNHCSFSTPGVGTFLPGVGTSPYSGKMGQVNEERELRFETLVPKARLGRVLEAMYGAHPYEEPAYDLVRLENPDPQAGIGRIGLLEKPVSGRAFAERVRKCLGVAHVRLVGDGKRDVSTVAVLGGAGGSQIPDVPRGVDAYVTGDLKYHDFDAAEGMGLVNLPHAAMEARLMRDWVPALAAQVAGEGVTVEASEVDTDPWLAAC